MEYSLQLRADKYLILVDIAPRYSMNSSWPHVRAPYSMRAMWIPAA
jgi:hypothetical protein